MLAKEWEKFYKTDVTLDLNQSYALHLWDKMSRKVTLESLEKDTLLYKLALSHCPYTMEIIGNISQKKTNSI